MVNWRKFTMNYMEFNELKKLMDEIRETELKLELKLEQMEE